MKKRISIVLSIGVALILNAVCLGIVLVDADVALADTFAAGSMIIPMDTTYQDRGMLKAYGLVYELLHKRVPVKWVIKQGKAPQSADFTASAKDHQTQAAIINHGYRGGPFVIDASDATAAVPIVDAWQAANPATVVHEVTAPFDADVARRLVAAPRIAVFANGTQAIDRSYLMAAGIPDSTLNPGWPDTSPDMLTLTQISGPTTTSHTDGALFDANGAPLYCQFISMHWSIAIAQANPEVIAEVRQFLLNPVNFLAECQAVPAFENDASHGHFLAPNGFATKLQPASVDYHQADRTFAQLDGDFSTVGGSYPAFALPLGDSYKASGVTMITGQSYPEGEWDVWMTGYLDGACPPESEICGNFGKVSYLGGHQYTVSMPISTNPETQGVRLSLNALFDSTCATASGQPQLNFTLSAPAETANQIVQYTINYANAGPSVAFNAVITDTLPSGTAFVSATNGGVYSDGKVTWTVGNLGSGKSGAVSFTVQLGAEGTYTDTAQLAYKTGVTPFTKDSNTTSTAYLINKPPVITAGATTTYTVSGPPVVIDRTITVADPDSANMSSATVIISGGFTSGDILASTNQNGISGSYNVGAGTMMLYGSSSKANYQNALRSITYYSTSHNPMSTSASRTISFTVNDGSLDSNTATSTIVIKPQTSIVARIKFEPQTLNKKSRGKWVSVEIQLPKQYKASDIDISSIRLEGTVHAEAKPHSLENRGNGASKLEVNFKRSAVIAVLPAGKKVPVHVTGNVGATAFEGVDIIKVIH